MSEHTRTSQSRFARLCDRISLCRTRCRTLASLVRIGQATPADELDQRLKRDTGVVVAPRPDPRGDHYRRLLRRGYPLW